MTVETAAAAYAAFFEGLTRDQVGGLRELCVADVRFRDPFNDVTGVDAFIRVMDRMFDDVAAPRFTIIDRAISGRVCYLRWDFTFEARKSGKPWCLEGMSEVHFDEAGRVTAHLDHWDAASQLYAHVPLLGPLLRIVRGRLSAG